MTFPELLRKRREEAGFSSARAFFIVHGGRAFFGCTYKQYLNVENGRSAPRPRLAHRLAAALRVGGDAGRTREFALACVESLAGSKEFAGFLVAAIRGPKPQPEPAPSPLARALERSFAQRAVPLTSSQSALLRSSFETYWCFTVLANDDGRYRPAELAAFMRCSETDVAASLRRLCASGLVSMDKKGGFYCPKAGAAFLHPHPGFQAPFIITEETRPLWERMAARSGKVIFRQHILTRASETELKGYFPILAQGIHGADVYSTREKGPDTAFILVETSVRRIAPF